MLADLVSENEAGDVQVKGSKATGGVGSCLSSVLSWASEIRVFFELCNYVTLTPWLMNSKLM